ncbi:MAG: DUF5931 domain-containing protein [Actinomycetota bacterium]|nr:DUF5931 domain-containing protein [Actinomycetota bacterium]
MVSRHGVRLGARLSASYPTVHPALASVTDSVEATLYRALAVLRVVVAVNMIGLNLVRRHNMDHPWLGWLVIIATAGWTGYAIWAYGAPKRWGPPLLLTDLAVAVAGILATSYVKGPDWQATLPGFWVMGVVLAWGIHWHWVGGLGAATLISAADLSLRADLSQTNYSNIFLLMIGGPVLGYTTGLLKEMAAARDIAERSAAAAAERARLARVVHDGVLQVLSLVQRRGLELGGKSAELGRLAGEQEVALRSLIQQGTSASSLGSSGDLALSLSLLQSRSVTVSVPGSPVLFPAAVVDEVTAVVRACLDNVAAHVGTDAPAWVLLEDLGPSVIVTVRDSGPGIPEGRLESAAAEGRLGVSESIRGRVGDLGGTAVLVTAPGEGTEWELTFPKP